MFPMTPKEELQAFCRDLEIAHPEGDETFYRIIESGQRLLKLKDIDLASIFDISIPTARRWINRENLPHPAMRKCVYKDFLQIARHIIEEHNGEA